MVYVGGTGTVYVGGTGDSRAVYVRGTGMVYVGGLTGGVSSRTIRRRMLALQWDVGNTIGFENLWISIRRGHRKILNVHGWIHWREFETGGATSEPTERRN